MELITDLHLHSKYARAVSRYLDLPELARAGTRKGIGLLATGDWTHPTWFAHLQENLEEVRPGIFRLRDSNLPVEFILGTEIACYYRQGDKGRRVHNLVFSPSLETCSKISQVLQKYGDLAYDGRPALRLSSKDLLKVVLDVDPQAFFIPAHIWTPWFSVFGSKSGFDSLEECFEELSPQITAVETGLSSDPYMNWQIKELENRAIVSFSDAHSGPKLGREATVLKGIEGFEFSDVVKAFQPGKEAGLTLDYTIEFFPEEGKYHWSGHRICGVRFSPEEDVAHNGICPVCKKPLTIGVENRVLRLAGEEWLPAQDKVGENEVHFVYSPSQKRPPFVSLVPLLEILQEILHSPTKAGREYERLITNHTEFSLLLQASLAEVEEWGGKELAEAIRLVRHRKVKTDPGYDGVFGKVTVF